MYKFKGKFKFKSIELKQGGVFKNSNGEDVNYKERFILKVDEISDGGINERLFKIPVENTEFINALNGLTPYTDILIEFGVEFYSNGIKCNPISISK